MSPVGENCRRLTEKFKEQIKIDFINNINLQKSVIATFIMGFLIHLYMFTNKLPNQDDLKQLFDTMHRPTYGRWFLSVPASISSMLSIPIVNGALAILYLSLSTGLVIASFRIKSKLSGILIGGFVVSFPVIASTFAYMQCADAFCFGILLICIAIYCADRMNYLGILIGILCTILSLGIYQAYLPFGISIMIGIIIKDVLLNKEGIIKKILLHLTTLGIGTWGYICIVKYSYKNLTEYKNINTIGQITVSNLKNQVLQAYKSFFEFFSDNNLFTYPEWFGIIYPAIIMVTVLFVVYKIIILILEQNLMDAMVLLGCMVLFPIGTNFIYIMCDPKTVYSLMRYGMVGSFILIIAIWEEKEYFKIFKNAWLLKLIDVVKKLVIVCGILVVGNHTIITNASYLKIDIGLSNAYADAIRLTSRIESVEGYTKEDEIIFVGGRMEFDLAARQLTWFWDPMFLNTKSDVLKVANHPNYLSKYVGFENVIHNELTTQSQLQELGILEFVNQMENYPNHSSIRRVDEHSIIVKFTDVEN